ncbi:protein translocase subunit SecF [Sphingomonas sp. LY29]|uniref:protein translocase subunit SecF n=1 Tax=unclassified Sphingomonas TaxID=196159 RepID=UPI002ADECA73|nr:MULTISPECIES: protein translocase subunit SecF [unclassified Sphingomonas]MEA1072124.1 protein translocase subunit SecF [Sphingomonas sp. LY160]WRP25212.1 protein translocase subunit SecF [Sphingomonas sp. LY29]
MKLLKLVPDNTNIDFMRWRNVAMILSTLLTVASLVLVGVRGLNLGIDFVGGQVVRATFAQPVDIEDLRGRIDGLGVGEATIQEFGNDRTYQIRLPRPEGPETASNEIVSKVRTFLPQEYPGAVVSAGESVSGKVSGELAWDGALAITFAMIGIALYIWFRFEWQFGVGALLTLFHDVSMVLGFFSLTQMQVDLNIVAAFLAIVGYSLNDTVVIYDRIRENMRKYRKMEIVALLNFSLNETLSRTIVTSLSIMLALAVLLALGPDVLFGLTLAILLGTFIGTYSSIYVSAPALVWLGLKPDSFLRSEDEEAGLGNPA